METDRRLPITSSRRCCATASGGVKLLLLALTFASFSFCFPRSSSNESSELLDDDNPCNNLFRSVSDSSSPLSPQTLRFLFLPALFPVPAVAWRAAILLSKDIGGG